MLVNTLRRVIMAKCRSFTKKVDSIVGLIIMLCGSAELLTNDLYTKIMTNGNNVGGVDGNDKCSGNKNGSAENWQGAVRRSEE